MVGRNIARLRVVADLSITQLGLKAGIDPLKIRRWENGTRIDADALPALARALGCSVEDFYAAPPEAA